jgi:hypothetical protein
MTFRSRSLPVLAVGMMALLTACQPERQHDHVYTINGQDLGAKKFSEISPSESKVSFIGEDPAKRREAMALLDRYSEHVYLKNNAVLFYTKVFSGGFIDRGEDMLRLELDDPFFKDSGIVYDRSKVRKASYFSYIVQSSPTFRCFLAHGTFGIGKEARQSSSGNQEISVNVCYPAAAKSEEAVEGEMLDLLSRARYGDNALQSASGSGTPKPTPPTNRY